MTEMRRRMEQELNLRGLSENTKRVYLAAVRSYAAFHHRPPDQMGQKRCEAIWSTWPRRRNCPGRRSTRPSAVSVSFISTCCAALATWSRSGFPSGDANCRWS